MSIGKIHRMPESELVESVGGAVSPEIRVAQSHSVALGSDISALLAQSPVWATVVEFSSEGIIVCDANQRIVFVNPTFEHITGYSQHEVQGRTPRMLQSGQHGPEFYVAIWQ